MKTLLARMAFDRLSMQETDALLWIYVLWKQMSKLIVVFI